MMIFSVYMMCLGSHTLLVFVYVTMGIIWFETALRKPKYQELMNCHGEER